MQLGVKDGTVKILPHSIQWAQEFENEKAILLPIFGKRALQIEHVGSTAIPNLAAKPLIDLAIQVPNIDDLNDIPKQLLKLNYQERVGRLLGRQKVFKKRMDGKVTHHLHIIELNEPDWDEKIKFRDALINDPELLKKYAELKVGLAKKFQTERAMYTKGKAQFIRSVLDNY